MPSMSGWNVSGGASGKEPPCPYTRSKRHTKGFSPLVRKIPWRRTWQPAPVFLPGESHGQRSLGSYSPWNSPGKNTGVGSPSLLQGIFPTQGSNPGLPHCRQILYQLSHNFRGTERAQKTEIRVEDLDPNTGGCLDVIMGAMEFSSNRFN